MRNGKLLAEKSPDDLMRDHNATLLEDVVLKLCRRDTDENDSPDVGDVRKNKVGDCEANYVKPNRKEDYCE